MKFIKLEILNLASLDRQDGETINFEEGALGNSTIFSIVGPTGSGKSTLLDAICLALYNRAPRYPKKRGDRNQSIEIYGELQEGERNRLAPTDARNILTRGKKAGYSKLTFLANNGNVYRAEWHVRFLTKKYGNAETHLYVIGLKDGAPVEEEANWDDLPQIIGLDYDQFLRTVLIAQGSFANFLTAKEEERCQLLEKLVGCEDVYKDIANRIKCSRDEAVEAYRQMADKCSAMRENILPDEELAAVNESIARLEAAERKAKEELTRVSEALGWYAAEEKFVANITKYQDDFDAARQRVDDMKPMTDRLSLHDATLEAVNLYKEAKVCEVNIAKQEASLRRLEQDAAKEEQAIADERQRLATLQEQATGATGELERQRPHINNARKIKAQLQVSAKAALEKADAREKAAKALGQARASASKNIEAIRKAEEELSKAKEGLDALTAKINADNKLLQDRVMEATELLDAESKKMEGRDLAQLQEAKTSAEKRNNDLKNGIRIQTDIKAKLESRKENEEKQCRLEYRNTEIGKLLETINVEALDEELSTLNATYTLMTSENWQQHRAKLKDGQPCPLCGATVHSYRSEEDVQPVVSRMKTLIDAKRRTLKEKTTEQKRLQREQSENNGVLKSLESAQATIAKEVELLGREWAALHESHPDWPEDAGALRTLQAVAEKDIERATSDFEAYVALGKTVERLRRAKETAERKVADYAEASVKQKEEAERKCNDASTFLTAEKAKTEGLSAQVVEKNSLVDTATEELDRKNKEILELKKALNDEIGDADPDDVELRLAKAKEKADSKVKEKAEAILKMQGDLQGLRGRMDTTRQTKQGEETALKDKKQALAAWLDSYNDAERHELRLSVDDIARLYSSTDDWTDIRARQKACNAAFTSAQTTLQNEVKAHADHQQTRPEADRVSLVLRKAELDGLSNDELVSAKARLKNHNDAKEKMGGMYGQMVAAETLKREWEEIAKAIGGDGNQLRKIAQCYTLRFLIEHANVEIRRFNTRYELQQVNNSLGIRVIDHDRADDVRDTTSLSGGETFIVSLGLALGLSALSSRSISFENLFIDEGFGTLDPDTLATVIDSLAMLQSSQGKKVGVISHTDTMSERITTQIRIIKNGSGSSHVEIYP